MALTLKRLKVESVKHFFRPSFEADLSDDELESLRRLRKDGLVVVENFCSSTKCNELRHEVELLLSEYGNSCWRDKIESDNRLFAANLCSPLVSDFYHDHRVAKLICHYLKSPNTTGYSMINRLTAKANNLGSGGGWHRDSIGERDVKAILYVNDVSADNGPFQYLLGSHRVSHRLAIIWQQGGNWRHKRFRGADAESFFASRPELQTVTGKAGTLVLADTTGIHRGCPISTGVRYAITNYYWPDAASVPPRMTEIAVQTEVGPLTNVLR
jgi:ectoine hydroxylase-related dioxygenase (phytanoyl-CoA dioxygenase family)